MRINIKNLFSLISNFVSQSNSSRATHDSTGLNNSDRDSNQD